MKSLIRNFDLHVSNTVLRLPESWHGFFLAVTALGDPIITVGIGAIVAVVGFAVHNVRLGLAGVAIWLTLIVGSILKLLFGRERPVTEYVANLRVDTFSFPSGHSSGAMIAYGLLAYFALKLLPQPYGMIAAIICGIIILLVGVSRVYLGAHFPSDVVAGWLLGATVLTLVIYVLRPLG